MKTIEIDGEVVEVGADSDLIRDCKEEDDAFDKHPSDK